MARSVPSGKLKIAVLISGRGTNLQSLIDAIATDPDYPAEIALVLSNKASAKGLARAEAAGLQTKVINHKDFEDRESFDAQIEKALEDAGVELVVLAGFMRLFSDGFVDRWKDRLINVHPALLPAFRGLHVHERMLDAGVKIAGATVFFVRQATDEGPIINQGAVPVLPDDTPESLEQRILKIEYQILPAAVRMIGEGRVRVVQEKVQFDKLPDCDDSLVYPPVD